MAEPPIVDASPIILLAHGGLLELLQVLGDHALVTTTVADEIEQGSADDPAVSALQDTSWLSMVDPGPIPARIAAWNLDPGEESVLA